MPSSLFNQRQNNSLMAAVNQIKALGNPQTAYDRLYQTNPQFRQFANSVREKTPEQAFRENGFDYNQFRDLF